MATTTSTRERKPSTSAPISDLQGPIGPAGVTRPKHKRTVTGYGPGDIKSVEASIPEPQRAAAAYGGTALAFRDRMVIDWNRTQQNQTFADQKRVYCMRTSASRLGAS
ncbi:hypothetical protein LTR28_003442 [Elasticomyces elasticus]|nr:hypothetical protein LTR28_003442 [Elasticomyces elasticus]